MLLLSSFDNFDSYYNSTYLLKIKYKFFITLLFFYLLLHFMLSHSDCGHVIS